MSSTLKPELLDCGFVLLSETLGGHHNNLFLFGFENPWLKQAHGHGLRIAILLLMLCAPSCFT